MNVRQSNNMDKSIIYIKYEIMITLYTKKYLWHFSNKFVNAVHIDGEVLKQLFHKRSKNIAPHGNDKQFQSIKYSKFPLKNQRHLKHIRKRICEQSNR